MSNINDPSTFNDSMSIEDRIAAKRAEVLIALGSILDDLKRINQCLSSIAVLTQPHSPSPENERNSLHSKMQRLLSELEAWRSL
jgi:hypothetical protein